MKIIHLERLMFRNNLLACYNGRFLLLFDVPSLLRNNSIRSTTQIYYKTFVRQL